jgi:hypothetical protein
MINIQGLTKKDVQICKLLWNCDTMEAVDAMVAAMPPAYKQRAVIMRELMIAAELDNLETVHEDIPALLHSISSR